MLDEKMKQVIYRFGLIKVHNIINLFYKLPRI